MMNILFTKISLIFFLIGIASMLTHAVKKWVQGQIVGNLIDWYIIRPKASVGALMTCVGGVGAAILSGTLIDASIGSQILAAWGIGYAADTVNSQG
jgi:hypothetical protein